MSYAHHESDREIPYTVRDQKRIDKIERGVYGYVDDDGVPFVGALARLDTVSKDIHTIKILAFVAVAISFLNGTHASAFIDNLVAHAFGVLANK